MVMSSHDDIIMCWLSGLLLSDMGGVIPYLVSQFSSTGSHPIGMQIIACLLREG